MNAAALLSTLRAHGARVRVTGERVRVEGVRADGLPPELLEAARFRRDELLDLLRLEAAPHDHDLEAAPIVAARERVGAVLICSRSFGEVWLALDTCMVPELAAEEAAREAPRPVLLVEDVLRLRGKSEPAIRAAFEVARVFPASRVIS